MNAGCILLAAGESRRFGENKLFYEVEGQSMASRAIALHAAQPYALRVLVTQPDYAEIAALAQGAGFLVAYNRDPGRGISSSVKIGLAVAVQAAFTNNAALSGLLFGVCDEPRLTGETVSLLLQTFAQNPDRIVAPAAGGARGNPVVFPKDLFPALMEIQGDRGGGAVIARHPERLLTVEVPEKELWDADTKSAPVLAKNGKT